MATVSADIHPSASIDSSAQIGAGVVIEQGVIVGPRCAVGNGTRLRTRCMLVQDTVIGERNDVHPNAVLGGDPQDTSFDASVEAGRLEIGNGNVFRENVTINRGCGQEGPTLIGSECMFMAQAHAGHNVRVGDRVILANCVSLAGRSRVEGGCFFSATSNLHQFVDMGELVMVRAGAGATMHVPPFCIVKRLNFLGGINIVGLRRSGRFSASDIDDIRRVYRRVLRKNVREGGSFEEVIRNELQQDWSHGARHMLEWIAQRLQSMPPRARGIVSG
jgi:UDP-N-acetylglucosamine acyltransferase